MIVVLTLLMHGWLSEAPIPTPPPTHPTPIAAAADSALIAAHHLPTGVALPYPTARIFRGFGRCLRGGKHHHEAIDLGGVGPDAGLGTAVRSMGPGRITRIGRGQEKPDLYGTPDDRPGTTRRAHRDLPRTAEIDGYGKVCFFSKRRGSWRSGELIEVVGTAGPLAGHRVRYMHLGAIRPDLRIGDHVAPGEELGLFGGTGVMESSPHVHIDIVDADGEAVDVAPLLGLAPTATCGPAAERAQATALAFPAPSPNDTNGMAEPSDPKARHTSAWRPDRWPPPVGAPRGVARRGRRPPPVELSAPPSAYLSALTPTRVDALATGSVLERRIDLPDCASTVVNDDFSSGLHAAHTFVARLARGRWVEVALAPTLAPPTTTATWSPRLELFDKTTGQSLDLERPGPLKFTLLAAASGRSPRLRLIANERADIVFAIRAPSDTTSKIEASAQTPVTTPDPFDPPTALPMGGYRLELVERCKAPAPPVD